VKRRHRGLDNVRRGVEIGLAYLEVDDIASLCFECSRPSQDFERGFGSQAAHPAG
jgi:hypothetical protein